MPLIKLLHNEKRKTSERLMSLLKYIISGGEWKVVLKLKVFTTYFVKIFLNVFSINIIYHIIPKPT